MTSFQPHLAILVNGLYGVLLWNFYYFRRKTLRIHVRSILRS